MSAATPDDRSAPFWTRPLAELRTELGVTDHGLDAQAVALRRRAHGANTLERTGRTAALVRLLAPLHSPLVLLLLAACGVSAVLGDLAGALVISAIVLGSVMLDLVQSQRAGRAAEHLRESVALRSRVLREGSWQQLAATELVPGDLVQLAAGDLVPADGRIVHARDFFVRQSQLTGESFPVEKLARDLGAEAVEPIGACNAAFMGSSVLSGSATLLVCRTGRATYLGGIADTLQREAGPTAFETGTRRFGLLIVRMTFLLVLLIVVAHTLAQRPVHDTFLFAVALAVGLTPELLPMIVSVTLARGAVRMAGQQVIVKRLAAIQNMGSMDVLCTDKTGTLTEGAIRLERHVDPAGRDSARVLELAVLNSRFETGLRSPLDDAILQHGEVDTTGWQKIDEVPFGFERRRVSVLLAREADARGAPTQAERLLVVKGAPEDVLRLCTHREDGDGPRAMQPGDLAQATALFETLGREGYRVLAIASRQVGADHRHAGVDDETELVLAGFAAFLDPPKATAADALQRLRRSHVRVKVLTGDNEWVTRHVCAQVGLPVAQVLSGAQVEQLDDHALAVQAERVDVFCRVAPQQKNRIVAALRRRGHVVGFLGDGVNDAPALHDADVGISVDGAVDVARDAADLILLERDLGVLHQGVIEGRRTFANAMKYLLMASSSNFGNMFSMAAASLFLPFLPMLPTQILLNNLLYDSSEVAIPRDAVDAGELLRPHDWDPDFIRRFMLTLGPVSSAFDLLTFWVLLQVFEAGEALFRTGWFIESVATQVLVIFVIRTRGAPWHSRPDPWLAGSAAAVVAIAAWLPFSPLAATLGFVAPPAALLAGLAGMTLAYLACAEGAKRGFYRHAARHRRQRSQR